MVAVDTVADRILATLDIRPPCCMTGQPVKGVPQVSLCRCLTSAITPCMQPARVCSG